jgi:hypothetical protein
MADDDHPAAGAVTSEGVCAGHAPFYHAELPLRIRGRDQPATIATTVTTPANVTGSKETAPKSTPWIAFAAVHAAGIPMANSSTLGAGIYKEGLNRDCDDDVVEIARR